MDTSRAHVDENMHRDKSMFSGGKWAQDDKEGNQDGAAVTVGEPRAEHSSSGWEATGLGTIVQFTGSQNN